MYKKIEPKNLHLVLLLIFLLILIWSGINPKDFYIWMLEVFPVVIGLVVILLTYKRFRLTTLVYILILFHAAILMIGGHYTYAQVPFFNWIKDVFDLTRNHYDRLGHIVQGFVPAIIAREILIRTTALEKGKMFVFIVISMCLSISVLYELIEWGVVVASGEAANAFLGAQGDIWDTQWDMFFALCGAVLSLLILSKLHDKYLIQEEV